ncbi:WD40/YVTN/BNR-like repeat-containing protein [Fulvivirga lutea]|uniref:Glycosyl hydrolase n=1 Tax=Fulvivirga lutea TaxID=2810512 RepID=A0A974WGM6_9BACT|nr:glycosyl hydrolase [Fulvivirga lutea]QSE98158.1 glycosyl hydrolase [Fulvivirga lutea]
MKKLLIASLAILMCFSIQAQRKKSSAPEKKNDISLSGLKFRSIGPALTSGRISDFAVNPDNPKEYYVATSAGGVWKTTNAGTTYTPLFDSQGSYSIGCVTMDPNNSAVIWVGTGENNNQRSVSYGDGVYKSIDGGASWENVGLKNSEHIGNIVVHPDNSDVVYVSAIGPVWSSGGDRGLYKTTDGGKTWKAVLTIDEHTGVNEVVMDPRNPEILYASTFQRRRHVFTYIGGGPKSSIHKSTDGGATWTEIKKGLPSVDLGRIGLAIAPSNPDIIYAIVEAAQGKGGFYKSTNGGASWSKQGSYSSSGNYYQEIVVDPLDANVIYGMDTWMQVSRDGGKSFSNVGEDTKHVDNHCIWIDPKDTDHLLVGCDGGIYETFDLAATWQFKANLPVTQFYKVAVDNAEPFYYIYGGTQDNFSMGGPSRTISGNGIANSDWYITTGGDGFESAIDPENPNIVYSQSQYGYLSRYDKLSGEVLGIKPQPRKGEDDYRWNWDAPLQVSNHKASRLYFAANKVFRSDDRGNSWEVISDDLTAQINRNELEVMGKIWSTDAVAKNGSTSPYGTIVSFSESPKNENLLYVGTDDGLIQITEDGGKAWRKVQGISGVPSRTYVNEVYASKHNENVVYAAFNHHKYGDFRPYIYKSSDKGRSWTSITGNLPVRGSVYAIEEDHVDPNLLFVGTEFGVFYSDNGGSSWTQLKSGVPTVAIRDIAIQERENDLVLGTFGRGFYVLDDYSALRNVKSLEGKSADLMSIRDSYAFEYSYPLGLPGRSFQGDDYYLGENLGSEAIFTYYLKDEIKSKRDQRLEKEKETTNDTYPTYEQLKAEREEMDPYLLFTIKNSKGDIVRKITTSPSTGVNRINWNLRTASTDPINLRAPSFYNPWAGGVPGSLVPPGEYSVTLSKFVDGTFTQLDEPVKFKVKSLSNYTLPAEDKEALAAFQKEVNELSRVVSGAQNSISELRNELRHIREAINLSLVDQKMLIDAYSAFDDKLNDISRDLNGDPIAAQLDIDSPMSVAARIGNIQYEMYYSTSKPTETHKNSLKIAKENFQPLLTSLRSLIREDLVKLQAQLEDANAPYTPNRVMVP